MNDVLQDAVVERIYTNRSNAGRTYNVLLMRDGKRVHCFNTSEVEGVREGDTLTIYVKKDGDYLHLVKRAGSPESKIAPPDRWTIERESIVRQSVAKTTAILLQHKEIAPGQFKEWFSAIHELVTKRETAMR
jgi:hypothetical protein